MSSPGSRAGKGWKIPVYSGGGGSSRSRSSGGSSRKKSGGGGSGINYARAAEKRAIARENKAKAKAAARYRAQAETLGLQAKALKRSLGSEGFIKALNTRLANANLVYSSQDKQLLEGYEDRVGSLERSGADNEAAKEDSTFGNLTNRARERTLAVNEALLHGAGESDVLKAQMMSLRNWGANQGEVNRSFFDSLTSINNSLTDLNVDTKTARLNAETQLNSDKDQLWTQYYNQQAETYTQLGNVQGQQAELYGMANEQKSSGSSKSKQKSSSKASGASFMQASKFATSTWKNPGNSSQLVNWEGRERMEGRANETVLRDTGPSIPEAKKPEGASLRAWN